MSSGQANRDRDGKAVTKTPISIHSNGVLGVKDIPLTEDGPRYHQMPNNKFNNFSNFFQTSSNL